MGKVHAACKVAENPRVLVITMRRLGDVLLTTPLVHALRHGLPGARIDILVFRGSEKILTGNPDIARVIAVPEKPSAAEMAQLIARLWRRYDLSVTTQTGDRPALLAAVAGRVRIGVVPDGNQAWKRLVLSRSIATDPNLHRVVELNRLAGMLGIDEPPRIVVPKSEAACALPRAPYAVLHANPKYRIRRWTEAGWRALAAGLRARGLGVVATGGPAAEERAYLDGLWNPVEPPVERADGRLSWGELADLLAGAAVYVGPDTSMTHLAAASGCPTVAIYGPASPHGMGPWPVGGLERPWARAGTIQNRGNVWVVQNPLPCMPCDRLGCDNHLASRSDCLDTLPPAQVLRAVDLALGSAAAAIAGAADPPLSRPVSA
jgi:heptosyltransferase-3